MGGELTLDELVREMLLEMGETEHKYMRFLQHGISCLRELNLDVDGVATQVILPITNIDTVILPKNYIKYRKIGLCGTDGSIHALAINNDMCMGKSYDNCGNPIPKQPNSNAVSTGQVIGSFDSVVDNFRNGELLGRFFGAGGGYNPLGEYRIDKQNNVIQLGRIGSGIRNIVLEYLADRTMVNDSFMVHPYIIETVKSWIYWKSIQRNLRISLGEKQLAEQSYWKTYNTSKGRFGSETIDEWKQANT